MTPVPQHASRDPATSSRTTDSARSACNKLPDVLMFVASCCLATTADDCLSATYKPNKHKPTNTNFSTAPCGHAKNAQGALQVGQSQLEHSVQLLTAPATKMGRTRQPTLGHPERSPKEADGTDCSRPLDIRMGLRSTWKLRKVRIT